MPYILSLNCGSSSLKSKLFFYGDKGSENVVVASASASNIGAKGKKIEIKASWTGEGEGLKKGEHVLEKEQDEVDYTDLPGLILKALTESSESSSSVNAREIKYITHRVVHGSINEKPIIVTKDHQEGLQQMDKLSDFAPLHNHHAVLAVRSCLDALPSHTSVLLFDTLFHQTLPEEVYTYAVPRTEESTPVPLRKYGFHGLSYASVLRSIAQHLDKPESQVNAVVCHLGSGGSVCMIENGKSMDTSMGLTPLEGIIGGTRSGSIDPTLIFHHTPDCSSDVGTDGMHISKAELVLNKSAGLVALAGTSDFGTILSRIEDPSSCSKEEHQTALLAYKVYLDRLLHFVSFYVFKLLAKNPSSPLALCFSGGIGEKAVKLRADVGAALAFLGADVDEQKNVDANNGEGVVFDISKSAESKIKLYVVETDEEVQCARMAREAVGV